MEEKPGTSESDVFDSELVVFIVRIALSLDQMLRRLAYKSAGVGFSPSPAHLAVRLLCRRVLATVSTPPRAVTPSSGFAIPAACSTAATWKGAGRMPTPIPVHRAM